MQSPATLVLRVDAGHISFDVRVAPRSSRNSILGIHAGALKVALTSPPVEGAANRSLIALLSKRLNVAKSQIEIVRGVQSRNKTLRITGLTEIECRGRLASDQK